MSTTKPRFTIVGVSIFDDFSRLALETIHSHKLNFLFHTYTLPLLCRTTKKLNAKIVFVNCSRNYNSALVTNIGHHVSNGKWLVISDWALHYILEPAFPNTVRWTQKSTAEYIISVEPFVNSLWSNIVVLGADPQWWL